MGKSTGFLEYQRKNASYRPVKERLKDYKDVVQYLSPSDIEKQAARCMDCGVPFCHCSGCPVFNLIPEWNDLVYKNDWKEAYERLEKTNTLPEITGRVCPAPCEASCTLSINNSPVAIKQIELAIIENAFEKGWVRPRIPARETGKKIAIIGSGPAGLASAVVLRELGHSVTVFEKSSKIGGILRFGIPDFKLEKWVLDRRIDLMEKAGIHFETQVSIGEDLSVRYLKKTFDVILLAIGAGQPRDLVVPGRDLQGIYFAMDFLTRSNAFVAKEIEKNEILSAHGKTVLVIGGGDTGSDCIGTANRQGAKKVYQFEILPKPREWQNDYNPQWPEWPAILRSSSSHAEGVERDWSVLTKKFAGKKGSVTGAVFSRVTWVKKEKGFDMKEVPKSEFTLNVDMVLLAMGFVHVEHGTLIKDLKLKLDERNNIKTDAGYATSIKGVYACGDADTGASLVVRAIYHGQRAAESINTFLSQKNPHS